MTPTPLFQTSLRTPKKCPGHALRPFEACKACVYCWILMVPADSLISTLLKYHAISLGYGGHAERLQYTRTCIYTYYYLCLYFCLGLFATLFAEVVLGEYFSPRVFQLSYQRLHFFHHVLHSHGSHACFRMWLCKSTSGPFFQPCEYSLFLPSSDAKKKQFPALPPH